MTKQCSRNLVLGPGARRTYWLSSRIPLSYLLMSCLGLCLLNINIQKDHINLFNKAIIFELLVILTEKFE